MLETLVAGELAASRRRGGVRGPGMWVPSPQTMTEAPFSPEYYLGTRSGLGLWGRARALRVPVAMETEPLAYGER
ncbi:hypothetical protein NN561_009064 [Cricetulus griseus]